MATFTEEQIKEIQDKRAEGETIKWLSWHYETTPARIRDIVNGTYEYNRDREPFETFNLKDL